MAWLNMPPVAALATDAIAKAEAEAAAVMAEIQAALDRSKSRDAAPTVQPFTPRAGADNTDDRSDEEQEAARLEWLQYFMNVKDWAGAATMAITEKEVKELEAARKKG